MEAQMVQIRVKNYVLDDAATSSEEEEEAAAEKKRLEQLLRT